MQLSSLLLALCTSSAVARAEWDLPLGNNLPIAEATQTDLGNGVHVPGGIPINLYEPLQHRLAYAGSDGMTVSWSTFLQLKEPTVYYGMRPDKLDMVAKSNVSVTYPTSRTYNNHVKLQGLKPGTQYYYKVQYSNCAYCAYRPTYKFKTALAAGDDTPFSFASFGDLGLMGRDGLSTKYGPIRGSNHTVLGMNETNTVQSLLEMDDTYDFIQHVGDISYADYFVKASVQGYWGEDNIIVSNKSSISENYEAMNEQFFDQMQPVTARRPWMLSPGNHEASCDNGGYTDKINNITYDVGNCSIGLTNFTQYIERYRMPSEESGGSGNFWYSYDYGLAHFVSLDTETDLGHGLTGPEESEDYFNGPFGRMNEQINWLKKDLKAVDRTKTPWVIVGMHRPWYVSVSPPTWPAWQEAFEKIMYDNEVDVYTQGHVHVYERFAPMYNGTIDAKGMKDPRAPWPVVNGAAGHYDGLDVFDDTRMNGSMWGTDSVYGWGRMTVHNATHLTYEYVASRNSSVIDSATLYKVHDFGKSNNGKAKGHGKRAQIDLE